MKAICIKKCQKDRRIVFEVGKEYDITEEMLKSGFFKAVQPKVQEEK